MTASPPSLRPGAGHIGAPEAVVVGRRRGVPLSGGVFLHVVFQHWFQTLGGLATAPVSK